MLCIYFNFMCLITSYMLLRNFILWTYIVTQCMDHRRGVGVGGGGGGGCPFKNPYKILPTMHTRNYGSLYVRKLIRATHLLIIIASIMTQFWQASIIYKGRWRICVWNVFCLTCRCKWRNYRTSRTRCETSRMFSSDQVGCTSISRAVQLLENK